MAEGKAKHDWQQTSLLAAPLFNAIRNPKKRPQPFTPADFNPYHEDDGRTRGSGTPIKAGNIRVLKSVFVKPKRN